MQIALRRGFRAGLGRPSCTDCHAQVTANERAGVSKRVVIPQAHRALAS